MNDNSQKPTITDPTGTFPFTFVDTEPHSKYVEVEESMYNLTLGRIRELVRENAELKEERSKLEGMLDLMGETLGQTEADRITLADEVKLWRRWFDGEEEVVVGEPLFYQDVVNQRDRTDQSGALERSKKEEQE